MSGEPPVESQEAKQSFSFSEFEGAADRGTVGLLRRIWLNEKCAPEVLIYEDKVVSQIKSLVDSQKEYIASRKEDSKGATLSAIPHLHYIPHISAHRRHTSLCALAS